ncbi:MAG: tetratricopeptide repeat protein [Selenomonadaceae bacterium]|nr:tetratricopeptide repeat protein [Selenomonadaceae bacterium]
MAIATGPIEPILLKKEFTDRVDSRHDFWKRFDTMKQTGSTIITYYGASGVGKTSLLKELEKNIKDYTRKDIAFIHLDFKDKPSTLNILQQMRRELEGYGCNFPLFSTGEFYHFLKTGQKTEIDIAKIESAMDKNKWLSQVKKHWNKPIVIIDFFVPGASAVATGISIIGKALIDYWEEKNISDDKHKKIKERLDAARSDETNPYGVYELLPELFAQDVNDWLTSSKSEKNYLVIFLDTYEALTNEESATAGQLNAEAWLRSETGNPTGIMFLLENTLWVISGRNKLRWDGRLADELEQHKLEPLAQYDANKFLETAEVATQESRDYIYNLTKGLPFFLDICVDVYAQYKRDHNGAEPDNSIFGKKREDVVKRLLQYMDDGTCDMIKFLCGLGKWTDKIAFEIGTKTFNFSQTTYDRVKKFSFIQHKDFAIEDMRVENFSDTVFYFDRNIQSILLPSCAENVIEKTFTVADEYFSKVLKELKVGGKYLFNLEYWAKLTAQFAKSPDDLHKHYKENFELKLEQLIKKNCWFDIAENILKIFVDQFDDDAGKFKDFQNSIAFAYFERDFGDLKKLQGFYQDSLKYHNSAYEKFSRFLDEKHEDTVDAMNSLVTDFQFLGRYSEALTLGEKVLELTKNIFDAEHIKTIIAMNNLASTLSYNGRYADALELSEQALELCKKNLGDEHIETINAMNTLAIMLNNVGRYDESLKLQKKVLSLREKLFPFEYFKIIDAMNNLALTLSYSGHYEKAQELQEKVLKWRTENLGDKHSLTVNAINNLSLTLSYAGNYDKARELQEKVRDWRKENLGAEHPYTIAIMNNLATTLGNLGRYEDALKLQNEVLQLRKKILGDEHPKTIDAMNHKANTFINLGRYEEALKLQDEVLKLRINKLGTKHPKTIDARKNLADTYNSLNRHEDALPFQQQIEQFLKKNLGAEHPKTIDAMKNLALTLYNLGRYDEAKSFIQQAKNLIAKVDTADAELVAKVEDSYKTIFNS